MRRHRLPVLLVGGVAVVVMLASVGRADDSGQIEAQVMPIGEFSVVLDHPKPVKVGKTAKIRAEIRNDSGVDLRAVVATLHVDTEGLLFETPPTVRIGDLQVKKTAKANWRLRAQETGIFVLVATAEATTPSGDPLVEESNGVVLEVVTKRSE